MLGCYVSRCLWPAIYNVRTGWLLGLDKATLKLVIGFIARHYEIRSLIEICCDKEELETTEHLLCNFPDLSRLGYCRVCCDMGELETN